MLVNGKNECIHCTINNCTYHAKNEDYCTLEAIKVGTHAVSYTHLTLPTTSRV